MDEIIDFAELREYIHDQIRIYSSRMYMRRGFSVAVPVDPEMLLIDEVLAVGDAAFSRKGVDRINHCKKVGKTMVMVTHDLGLARTWCDEGAWLDAGQIKIKGDLTEIVEANTEQRCNEFIKAFGGHLGDKVFKTCTKEDAALRHTPGRRYQHNTGTCR